MGGEYDFFHRVRRYECNGSFAEIKKNLQGLSVFALTGRALIREEGTGGTLEIQEGKPARIERRVILPQV